MSGSCRFIIVNGRVVDPINDVDCVMPVCVEGGVIAPVPKNRDNYTVIDAKGAVIVPGLIDLHVHFREPGFERKEDIETGSKAAARGGFTSVCCMPNTNPAADCVETVEFIDRRGVDVGLVNLLPVGAITYGLKGERLTDFAALKRAGTLCKRLTGRGVCALSDDGTTPKDSGVFLAAAEAARRSGLFITDHVEDAATALRDVKTAEETGCQIHLQHIHSAENVRIIRGAKAHGVNITAETAPHYFALDNSAVEKFGSNAKMNPPLGSAEDREAIIQGLKDGVFDCIATDHAPHTDEEKRGENPPNGIVGLETAFAVGYTELVEKGVLGLGELVKLMSVNPAKILGLNHGGLSVGSAADLAIFDIQNAFVIRGEDFLSKGRNTPFEGKTAKGRAKLTMKDGKITWRDND